ncbi:MAG: hypothetical protein UV68_C0072G0001 [Candidatus Collierbacteria bacterium GW2011_GWC2_43_12]|uniref:Uncharacterized protein n=1 Tax=Candidatus Collierbacteria bacterium GW2011_GWC2_43_12 TaxID=1618390 RepID=A0A0G1D058_9BACT|nr:MAG: hypothetical protein UV68_C0072G0001 [Candidatus Collierbacteria bacterium GW2011_GWC2_43_12]
MRVFLSGGYEEAGDQHSGDSGEDYDCRKNRKGGLYDSREADESDYK